MPLLKASPGAQVLLACMPWASTSQPSLALGLIKAQLAQVGIQADVAYFNLLLADLVSPETYEATKNRNVMASEWVFAEGLTETPAQEGYLSYLASRGAGASELALWQDLRAASQKFFERCLESIPWESYRVVGFTTSMMQTVASLRMALLIKQRYPHIQIVFGGANCEGIMGQTLHRLFPHVDVVVRGEVDDIVHELFRRLLANEPLEGLPGLCYRQDGRSVVGHPAALVKDLTKNPVPEYGDYFEQLSQLPMREKTEVLVMFESSRGCWWGERSHCKFCALNGQGMLYRAKSVDQIVHELHTLKERYGISNFAAADNILDKRSIDKLTAAMEAKVPNIQVFYDIRADVSRQQMRGMARAGIRELEAGLENLSTPILKGMGKGATGIHNVRFLRRCSEFGIVPLWNYLYAFPGEKLEHYQELQPKIDPWLHHLPPPDVAFPLSLQRYAPYHSQPEKNGIEVTGALDDYKYIYGFKTEDLNELAYYFKFRYLDGYDPDPTALLLTQVVTRWQERNRSGVAQLRATLQGDEVFLADTRSGIERTYRLDPIASMLYRLAESPQTVEQLGKALLRMSPQAYLQLRGNTSAVLERMEAAHLFFREGEKLVALAVPDDDAFWLEAPPQGKVAEPEPLRVTA
ncbi:MAG TPA: RiPP maturation radical SAM C-methyltransferase [Hyalangium sp.]|nr:RiPP maturation radical SAM C-methyltransferase [Hyalangium sp.]